MNIDRDYCVMMGRYNAWQNRQLRDLLQTLGPEELVKDRGAFFGSILGTLSHLVWGDQIWMSRFDGGAAPELAGTESTVLVTTFDAWSDAREQMDARIGQWAAHLSGRAGVSHFWHGPPGHLCPAWSIGIGLWS